jgi:cysteinyl-tRNA synthetase
MAARYLGPYFDIHCGGEDHIMVHHPNEMAQTQACHGTRLANFWMHGYFLNIDTGRMGKSLGNFLRLQTLIDEGYDPLAWRYFCLGAHYRSKVNFNWEALDGAATALQRLRTAAHEWGLPGQPDGAFLAEFTAQVNDDLNLPRALAVMWDLSKSNLPAAVKKATLLQFDRVLGLGLEAWRPAVSVAPSDVLALVEQRQQARRAKRWAEADALRAQIEAHGFEIEDTPQGPQLRTRPHTHPNRST